MTTITLTLPTATILAAKQAGMLPNAVLSVLWRALEAVEVPEPEPEPEVRVPEQQGVLEL